MEGRDLESSGHCETRTDSGSSLNSARKQVNSMLAKQAMKQRKGKTKKAGELERLEIKEAVTQQLPEILDEEIKVPCDGRPTALYRIGPEGMTPPALDTYLPPQTAKKHRSKHRHLHIRQAPTVGASIRKVELEIHREVVGRGAQGVVRRAYHKPTGAVFAIKEIQVQPLQGVEVSMKQVQRELERCCMSKASRQCDCLVQSYEAYFSVRRNTLSILMEWMDYGSLSDILGVIQIPTSCASCDSESMLSPVSTPTLSQPADRPPSSHRLPASDPVCTVEYNPALARMHVEDVSLIAYYGLVGLQQLRELGQIHNDIKPGNLLVNREGKLKIGDFGVAQWTDSISMARSNSTGSQLFMAPECIRGDEHHTYAADIYSLGLTVAHCAMGTYPLAGVSTYFLLKCVAQGKACVEFPQRMGADDDLQAFVRACMQPRWEDRPTAKELLQHKFITKFGDDPESRRFHFLSELERVRRSEASQLEKRESDLSEFSPPGNAGSDHRNFG